MKDAPADCGRNDSISDNWFGAATHMLTSLFTLKEDKCQKYYEHMMIDPFVKVPPTKVIVLYKDAAIQSINLQA